MSKAIAAAAPEEPDDAKLIEQLAKQKKPKSAKPTEAATPNPVEAFIAKQKAAGQPEPLDSKRLVIVPNKGASFAAYKKCVSRAMAIIHASESGYTTAAYWSLGRALNEIHSRHIWPAGSSFAAWCLGQEIDNSRKSRAKGISDFYGTIEEAAVVSLPDAIKAMTKMRAEEREKEKGSAAHRKVSAANWIKKFDSVKRQFDELRAAAEKLTAKDFKPIEQKIVQFAAEVKLLVARLDLDAEVDYAAGHDLDAEHDLSVEEQLA